MNKKIIIHNTSYIESDLLRGALSVFEEKDLVMSKEEVFDGETVFSDRFEKTVNGYTFLITKKELENRKIKTETSLYQVGDTVERLERKPDFRKEISELFVKYDDKIYICPSIIDGNGYSGYHDKIPFNIMSIKENRKKSNGKFSDTQYRPNKNYFDVNIQNYFDETRYHYIPLVKNIRKENFERNLENLRHIFLDSIYVYNANKNAKNKFKDSEVHLINYDIFIPACYCPTIVLTERIVDLYELAFQNKIDLSNTFDENQLNISIILNSLNFFKKTLNSEHETKINEKDVDDMFELIENVQNFYMNNNLKELLVADLNKTYCCLFGFNHVNKEQAKDLAEKITDFTQKNIHKFPEKENIRKRIEIFNELFYNKNYNNAFKI